MSATDTSNTAHRFDAIAIDLDGTLVDSACDLHEAANRMQDALQMDRSSEADARKWIGNGIERFVHRALTQSMDDDADSALFTDAMTHFAAAYRDTNGQYSALYAGVADTLQWMVRLGVPLVCVTNKARKFAEPLLHHHDIARYFKHLVAGDDVVAKKPDPAPLLRAAQLCSVPAAQCALIGDSVSDIRAAKAAGFTCICVSYGYNHGVDIRSLPDEHSADVVIDSFAELQDRLAR